MQLNLRIAFLKEVEDHAVIVELGPATAWVAVAVVGGGEMEKHWVVPCLYTQCTTYTGVNGNRYKYSKKMRPREAAWFV